MENKTEQLRRHRGQILQLVYDNHEAQRSHMDDVQIWSILSKLAYDVGQNYVIARLQSLHDRGYLHYFEERNRVTGKVAIRHIELTSSGRNLVERITEDPAVLIP